MIKTALPLLLGSLLGCATFPAARAPGSAVWKLSASTPDPQLDALAEKVFAGAFDPAQAAQEAQAALARNTQAGALHEILGYLAMLGADTDQAWKQFLLAALDVNNPFAAHDLWESQEQPRTFSERLDDLDALKLLESEHPDANVRALAADARAEELRILGLPREAEAETARLQFISQWKLIGAFDNQEGRGFASVLPPEQAIDLAALIPGAVVPVGWRSVEQTDRDGAVPLGALVSPSQEAVAYLLTYINVAQDTAAQLRVSTPAPLLAWLNDGEVAREERLRRGALDNVVIAVQLRAGWNKLLLKSAVKKGAWQLAARLTDANGVPLAVSAISAEPHPTPQASGKSQPATLPAAASARERLARARELLRRGAVHEAAEATGELQSQHPDNLLLRLLAAEVLRDDGQVEHALDLLANGMQGLARPPPRLLVRRASIYREKHLDDLAEDDLARALELTPQGSRLVQLQLAAQLGERGWQQERRARLEKALQLWPDSLNARVELADCLLGQGHRERALRLYQEALRMEPGDVEVLNKLRRLADEGGDRRTALSYLQRVLALEPFNVATQLELAQAQRSADDPAAAEATLVSLLRQSPDLASAYRARAELAEEQGDAARALALWEQAGERNPNDNFVAERIDHLRPHEPDIARKYVATDQDIDAAIKAASTVTHLPGSQSALLLDSEAVQVNSDGSSKRYVVKVSTVFTQNGRDELIRASLPAQGKTRVLAAYVVQPDGEQQQASSIEKTGVRFRKLQVGSTVVLRLVEYTPKVIALPTEYWNRVMLTSYTAQVEQSTFTLITPHGRQLSVDATAGVHKSESVDGNWDVRRFGVEHAPAETYEQSMTPAAVDHLQWVAVSTLPNWDKFIAWEKAILLDSFRPDPQIHALALKLTDGAKSQQEKVDRLFRFVAQEIRYQQEYESILAGWQPHPATVVLERKYGDCKDKATLFISLAREVGIDGQFAVLPTHHIGKLSQSVVLPYFNHAIAYVPEQPGLAAQFIDNTVDALDVGNLRWDDQGASSLLLDPKSGEFHWLDIPHQGPSYERFDQQIAISIDAPGAAKMTDALTLRGTSAAAARKTLRSDVQAQKFYESLASFLFPRATLTHGSAVEPESIDHPLVINTEADLSNSISAEGEEFRLHLPSAFSLQHSVALATRKTSLDLATEKSSTFQLSTTLADGLRLKTPPKSVAMKSACFEISREVSQKENALTVTDRFELRCAEISAADYPAFRADVERAAAELDAAVVFERAGKTLAKPARRAVR